VSTKQGAVVGSKNASLLWGLFFLRFGLGLCLALWAVDKFIAPEQTVKLFQTFYRVTISPSLAIMAGALELVLGLLIIFGMYKTITYGAGLLIYTISTIMIYSQLITPFGNNHLVLDAIPLVFAFFALFLLREFDTKLSLGRRKSLFI